MMRRIILAFLLLSMVVTASGQKKEKQTAPAEQEILALNQAWCDAIVKGDLETLNRLFSDDMIVTSGDGKIRNKADEIADLKPSADLKTYFFNTDDLRVRVYGDSAVVTGHAKWRINYKGRDIDNERRFLAVYVKQKGQWQIVAQQLTRLPQPKKIEQ